MDNNKEENRNLTNEQIFQEKLNEVLKPRELDKDRYSVPSPDDCAKAGLWMYKLNLLGSSLDENLQAMILTLWVDIYRELREKDDNHNILHTLSLLKEYLDKSDNPLLKTDALPDFKLNIQS